MMPLCWKGCVALFIVDLLVWEPKRPQWFPRLQRMRRIGWGAPLLSRLVPGCKDWLKHLGAFSWW
jgi:hypothetical protein